MKYLTMCTFFNSRETILEFGVDFSQSRGP